VPPAFWSCLRSCWWLDVADDMTWPDYAVSAANATPDAVCGGQRTGGYPLGRARSIPSPCRAEVVDGRHTDVPRGGIEPVAIGQLADVRHGIRRPLLTRGLPGAATAMGQCRE